MLTKKISFLFFLLLILTACSSRGIPLAQQLPEIYNEFDKNQFVKIESKKDYIYYSKKLATYAKPPSRFNEKDYKKIKTNSGFEYYEPKHIKRKNRASASSGDLVSEGFLKKSQTHNGLILDYE